jgi:hypothetical protein
MVFCTYSARFTILRPSRYTELGVLNSNAGVLQQNRVTGGLASWYGHQESSNMSDILLMICEAYTTGTNGGG